MEAVAGSAAYGEAIVFLGCFRDFPDRERPIVESKAESLPV